MLWLFVLSICFLKDYYEFEDLQFQRYWSLRRFLDHYTLLKLLSLKCHLWEEFLTIVGCNSSIEFIVYQLLFAYKTCFLIQLLISVTNGLDFRTIQLSSTPLHQVVSLASEAKSLIHGIFCAARLMRDANDMQVPLQIWPLVCRIASVCRCEADVSFISWLAELVCTYLHATWFNTSSFSNLFVYLIKYLSRQFVFTYL